MATDILVIGGPLVGGKSLKFIYQLYNPDGSTKLYQFIIICGVVTLILAQLPSFHSLRHINLISLIQCDVCHMCHNRFYNAPPRHYSVRGSNVDKLFDIFNGISIIATTNASGIIPGIQQSQVIGYLVINPVQQFLLTSLVYVQPTNELFETTFGDPKMGQFSISNVVPRVLFRSVSVAAATVLAAMLPFFLDIMALLGTFGCISLDFILPMHINNARTIT
ncbi:GABA transporter 1 [Mucuna pruriens]|uniref:GABA transporter 1 n=1 Tax=Mucuna pruriens TaxID=157652 RepID=A0A371ED95_MUCPR|nr:GABA transporter 1 [Mucuna pruriens]